MEIEQSPFYNEIAGIAYTDAQQQPYTLTAIFTANNLEVAAFKVIDWNVLKDYLNNYTDEMILSVMILAGDYLYDVYPYRNNLQLTIYKEPLDQVSGVVEEPVRLTYKVLLKETLDLTKSNLNGRPVDKESLNLIAPLTVQMDLVRDAILQMRQMSWTGRPFRNITGQAAIRAIMTSASQQVKASTDQTIQGVKIAEANNTKPCDHILIPHGKPVVSIPGYIQKNCQGVYTNGIGVYLQSNWWHVFAPFDVSQYKKTQKVLTIYRIPSARFKGFPNTWALRGDSLVVLAAGEYKEKDSTQLVQLDVGVGTMYADPDKIMNGFTKADGKTVTASRADAVSQIAIKDRPDGYNMNTMSKSRITANHCVEQSILSKRQGSLLTVIWDFSKPELIEPCMPVKIYNLLGEDVEELDGTVLCCDSQYRLVGTGVSAVRHNCTTSLHIFYKPTL